MPGHRYSEQYPELFAPLTKRQVFDVEQALANGRLEGWQPSREEIADLVDGALGRLSPEEHLQRALRRAGVPAPTRAAG